MVVSQITPNINIQLTKIPPTLSGRISGDITGDDNPVPEFTTPTLLILTLAATTTALIFAKKKTTKKTQK